MLSSTCVGMRTEDLLVRDAASAELGERPSHGAGVAGVGNGGDARGPAFANALPRRLEELLRRALRLEGAEPANPGGEVGLVGCGPSPVSSRWVWALIKPGSSAASGKYSVGRPAAPGLRHPTSGPTAAIRPSLIDEHRAVPDRRRHRRKDPLGREAPRRHQRGGVVAAGGPWPPMAPLPGPGRQPRQAGRVPAGSGGRRRPGSARDGSGAGRHAGDAEHLGMHGAVRRRARCRERTTPCSAAAVGQNGVARKPVVLSISATCRSSGRSTAAVERRS